MDKANHCELSFISVEKTLQLIMDGLPDGKDHAPNLMNKRFFKNQTCLAKDGYDLDNIIINDDSTPSHADFKKAILEKIAGVDNPILHEYGFSKKRTLENLQNLGVIIPSELIETAKSFVQDDDYCDDTGAYYECLPYEYALLYRDHEKALARIRELETGKIDELDPRTANNFVRLALAINEMEKVKIDFSAGYSKNTLTKINEKLDLLGYETFGETALKTLINHIKEQKSKGL